ncbi:uncharacterized protein CTRU02_210208 [Colletotrichum truncatum]|uniref:Uncharacterized protein n=1 Tax=Colletotrichum truncatum TaxID=5467 RepID=A0ACC3YUU9_COLTU|nr:uncharacterized protein CTRU02_11418 [Colletotrichum truncatum]KAF6785793.1 hypothetical protein CTRU02_11418 [Colletotrichum truncatum]
MHASEGELLPSGLFPFSRCSQLWPVGSPRSDSDMHRVVKL